MMATTLALMIFAALGNVRVCEQLIDQKADASQEDKFGCRAVQYAAALGHDGRGMQEFLLTHDTKATNDRLVPIESLGQIVREGCAGVVWRYVNEMPLNVTLTLDINRPTPVGTKPTPLHIATTIACKGTEEVNAGDSETGSIDPKGLVVRALLHWKADPSIPDLHGETALHVAAQRAHVEIYNELFVALTLLHGGRVAESVVNSQQDRWGNTPGSILKERRALTKYKKDQQADSNRLAIRVIFAFWGTFRRSLDYVGWRELYDMNNVQLETVKRRSLADFVDNLDAKDFKSIKKGKKKHHLKQAKEPTSPNEKIERVEHKRGALEHASTGVF